MGAIYQAHKNRKPDIWQLNQDLNSMYAGLFPDDMPDLPQRMLGNIKNLKQENDKIDELLDKLQLRLTHSDMRCFG